MADTSRLTATVAVRILKGEKAGDIKVAPVEFSAALKSPRTTKLYDRTADEITIEEVEKITI